MASVRMTNDLRRSIHQKALTAFDVARPEPTPNALLTEQVRDGILNSLAYKVMKETYANQRQHLFKSLGGYNTWVHSENESKVILHSDKFFDHNNRTITNRMNLVFNLVPSIPIYRNRGSYHIDFHHEELPAEYRELTSPGCVALCDEIKEYNNDRHQYSRKIELLLEQVTSVKQLLEAWPAAESFVPSESIQRMYVKVTRAQRAKQAKEAVQFDESTVNQVVLTAKIIGA
jgi:hypothetical protein